MTRDPNSFIAASAEHLAETLTKKNSDYAPTGEFSNFEKSAEFAGITPLQLMLAQISIKMTRIETLFEDNGKQANNEPLIDSLLDLAGYSVIAHAYLESGARPERAAQVTIEDREAIRVSLDDVCWHHWKYVGGLQSECTDCGEIRHG